MKEARITIILISVGLTIAHANPDAKLISRNNRYLGKPQSDFVYYDQHNTLKEPLNSYRENNNPYQSSIVFKPLESDPSYQHDVLGSSSKIEETTYNLDTLLDEKLADIKKLTEEMSKIEDKLDEETNNFEDKLTEETDKFQAELNDKVSNFGETINGRDIRNNGEYYGSSMHYKEKRNTNNNPRIYFKDVAGYSDYAEPNFDPNVDDSPIIFDEHEYNAGAAWSKPTVSNYENNPTHIESGIKFDKLINNEPSDEKRGRSERAASYSTSSTGLNNYNDNFGQAPVNYPRAHQQPNPFHSSGSYESKRYYTSNYEAQRETRGYMSGPFSRPYDGHHRPPTTIYNSGYNRNVGYGTSRQQGNTESGGQREYDSQEQTQDLEFERHREYNSNHNIGKEKKDSREYDGQKQMNEDEFDYSRDYGSQQQTDNAELENQRNIGGQHQIKTVQYDIQKQTNPIGSQRKYEKQQQIGNVQFGERRQYNTQQQNKDTDVEGQYEYGAQRQTDSVHFGGRKEYSHNKQDSDEKPCDQQGYEGQHQIHDTYYESNKENVGQQNNNNQFENQREYAGQKLINEEELDLNGGQKQIGNIQFGGQRQHNFPKQLQNVNIDTDHHFGSQLQTGNIQFDGQRELSSPKQTHKIKENQREYSGQKQTDSVEFDGQIEHGSQKPTGNIYFGRGKETDYGQYGGQKQTDNIQFGSQHEINDQLEGQYQTDDIQFGSQKLSHNKQYEGQHQTDDVQFSGQYQTDDVHFEGQQQTDNVQFSGQHQTDDVQFSGQEQTDDVHFGGQKQTDNVQFSGQHQTDDVQFSGQKQTDDVHFGGQKQTSNIQFGGQRQTHNVHFGGQKQRDNVHFNSQEQTDDVHFGGQKQTDVHFGGQKQTDVHFGGQKQTDELEFSGQHQTDDVHFGGQKQTDVHFGGQKQTDELEFSGQHQTDDVHFGSQKQTTDNVQFGGHRQTHNVHFGGQKQIDNIQFSGQQETEDVQFNGQEQTDGVHFGGQKQTDDVHFGGQKQTDEVQFSSQQQTEDAQYSGQEQTDDVHFGGQKQTDDVQFSEHQTDDVHLGGQKQIDEVQFGSQPQTGKVQFGGQRSETQTYKKIYNSRHDFREEKEYSGQIIPGYNNFDELNKGDPQISLGYMPGRPYSTQSLVNTGAQRQVGYSNSRHRDIVPNYNHRNYNNPPQTNLQFGNSGTIDAFSPQGGNILLNSQRTENQNNLRSYGQNRYLGNQGFDENLDVKRQSQTESKSIHYSQESTPAPNTRNSYGNFEYSESQHSSSSLGFGPYSHGHSQQPQHASGYAYHSYHGVKTQNNYRVNPIHPDGSEEFAEEKSALQPKPLGVNKYRKVESLLDELEKGLVEQPTEKSITDYKPEVKSSSAVLTSANRYMESSEDRQISYTPYTPPSKPHFEYNSDEEEENPSFWSNLGNKMKNTYNKAKDKTKQVMTDIKEKISS